MVAGHDEVEGFLTSWNEKSLPMKDCFQKIYAEVLLLTDVSVNFLSRPGVSYSLRPKHKDQKDRELFAIIDVIDDDPDDRWLSVCFYGDMITDPEEKGEVIPGGLAGSDGYCFDMYDNDAQLMDYVISRVKEAGESAAGG